ncbi:hypothetical protein GCM10020369_00050 [Cryptosporangium minutisporangium]|uniref:ATPase AAA-type core domain-containing protein n=2 Tax=Cryptosporangium minutisporangium TaxID=113569 RepID=A0ABP6SQC5_9ACTN
MWLLMESDSGEAFEHSPAQMTAALAHLSHVQRDISDFMLQVFGHTSELEPNIGELLQRTRANLKIPDAVVIPTMRQIRADGGEPSPELRESTGLGVPGMLQAWQAPAAERYREDSEKFRRINQLLKSVLEDKDVEITIPYNRSTVHVIINDRVLPLENLGTGISQLILLAVFATWHQDDLVCVEEPELNLHPLMLRKLVNFLVRSGTKFVLTTHSAHLLDAPEIGIVRVSYSADQGTILSAAISDADRAQVSRHLGYRASDLIQSNAIIWVEGPSDRIYLRYWIEVAEPRLVEGIHYSIMFYGGRLLAHLTGEEMDTPDGNVEDFISLLRINRSMAIVIDSDKSNLDSPLNATKERICQEFADKGCPAWVTYGREIENYVPAKDFVRALTQVHPSVKSTRVVDDVFADRFAHLSVSSPNKAKIAERVVEIWDGQEIDSLDLVENVRELVAYICVANDMPPSYEPHTFVP